MPEEAFTGASLEQALRSGELDKSALQVVGMVKAADDAGKVSFTLTSCDAWVDIPTKFIEKAEQLSRRSCGGHTHPVFRLQLRQPKDPEAQLLAALLTSASGPDALSAVPAAPAITMAQMGPWDPGFASSPPPRPIMQSRRPASGPVIGPLPFRGSNAMIPATTIGCTQCHDTPDHKGSVICVYLVCDDTDGVYSCHLITQEEDCFGNPRFRQ